MRVGYHISSVKTKVIVAAAAVFLFLSADWCSPGDGLHRAALALGGYGSIFTVRPSVWGLCVKAIGWDVRALGTLSTVCALAAMSVYAVIVADLVRWALALAKLKSVKGTHRYDGVNSAVSVVAGVSFLAAPGFLMAATRVDPLMLGLLFLLSSAAMMLRMVLFSGRGFFLVLRENKFRVFVAILLFALGLWEFQAMGRAALHEAIKSTGWFAVIGVLPMLALVNFIRTRRILKPSSILAYLLCWAFILCVSGTMAVVRTRRGREVSRIVDQIVDDARGCDAILSEGYLDDMLLFTKPRGLRLISFVRDNDEFYRRDLSKWTFGQGLTNLVWAAEIGPRTFIDEWARTDRTNCLNAVRTSAFYFPTVGKWRAACGVLKKVSPSEPLGAYMIRLVTACGNDIGCRFLDEGRDHEAWSVFWEILDKVDGNNCTAIANLYVMIKRGYPALTQERDKLARINKQAVKRHKSARHIIWDALTGGRIYFEAERGGKRLDAKSANDLSELSPREREFVKTVADAPNSSMSAEKARQAIYTGLETKLVRLDRIAPQLLRLDLILGDWASAEKDARRTLDAYPRHAVANHVLGLVKCNQDDFGAAEVLLRKALMVSRADPAMLNDLAFVLTRLKRFDEAMRFAAAAVEKCPNDWNYRETLALAQIRGWNPQEGERTLKRAIQLAEAYGVRRSDVARFELDYAWLCVARHDAEALSAVVAALEKRANLKSSEQKELAELRALK